MHASIWRYEGDPDELVRSYDAMLREVSSPSMRLHLCMRTDDGMIVVDTCPSQQIFEDFASGPFRALRERHGLPDPTRVEDHPVHAAFADGRSIV
jgi:hypothetical protein